MRRPIGQPAWVLWLLRTGIAAGSAVLFVAVVATIGLRLNRRRPAIAQLLRRERWPVTAGLVALTVRVHALELVHDVPARDAIAQVSSVALVGALAWMVVRATGVLEQVLHGRFDVSRRDNLRARTARTQVQVLRRFSNAVVVVIAAFAAMQTLPWARGIGASLLAAGGVLGIVAGVSGRSTIGNVIAGLQIALSEPVRLDDVVVVEGEWGRIEEITLTYVVVQLWDERRLVLPTSWFVEQPFQNWTRKEAQITGAVELWVDHGAPVDALRLELDRLLRTSTRWDGRVNALQVVEASPSAIKVRALVSAADAPTAWDLRCDVREGLVRWLTRHCPDALPRIRTDERPTRLDPVRP